jgi:isobutyryl-CoA mutase
MRSLATRQANLALSPHVHHAVNVVKAAGFDLVLLETSGIGQSDTEIVDYSDISMYVMTPDYGAATQLEKIDMLDFADLVAINKADKEGALDALRDVRKQWKRNHLQFNAADDEVPVVLTIASDFNDPGTNRFYRAFCLRSRIAELPDLPVGSDAKQHVVPPERSRYLAEIVEEVRGYNDWAGAGVGGRAPVQA